MMHERKILNLMEANNNRCYVMCLLLTWLLISCSKSKTSVCNDNDSLYEQSPFKIGTIGDLALVHSEQKYLDIVTKQFNSITPENLFKPSYLHPDETLFQWEEADQLAEFCSTNNKRLHGHTLIWHQQLPAWMQNFKGTSADWEAMMKTHIKTIVAHFKGKVKAWDVVNEAFNEDGTLRKTIWQEHLGNDYIAKAFIYAHEADPEALLFYNDYSLESNRNKRNAVISYLNNLRQKEINVDGIGLQMHLTIPGAEASEIAETLQLVSHNNYRIHISELDVSVNPLGKNIGPDKALFEKQADLYGKVALHYMQIPEKYQYGITIWGISDKNSWIRYFYNRNDYPLLYNDDYDPKPAYCKLKEIL
jgi:endo-1,4-beta-xylanase